MSLPPEHRGQMGSEYQSREEEEGKKSIRSGRSPVFVEKSLRRLPQKPTVDYTGRSPSSYRRKEKKHKNRMNLAISRKKAPIGGEKRRRVVLRE